MALASAKAHGCRIPYVAAPAGIPLFLQDVPKLDDTPASPPIVSSSPDHLHNVALS